MNDDHDHVSDHADGLPSLLVRVGSRLDAARGSSNTNWAASKPSLCFNLLAWLLLSSHVQRKKEISNSVANVVKIL